MEVHQCVRSEEEIPQDELLYHEEFEASAATFDRSDITFYPEDEIRWTNKICGLEKQTSLFKRE